MICKNPGGGTPPPNFTQGGVMDCHPPPLETAYVTPVMRKVLRNDAQNLYFVTDIHSNRHTGK